MFLACAIALHGAIALAIACAIALLEIHFIRFFIVFESHLIVTAA